MCCVRGWAGDVEVPHELYLDLIVVWCMREIAAPCGGPSRSGRGQGGLVADIGARFCRATVKFATLPLRRKPRRP